MTGPNEFWAYIKALSPRSKQNIPCEIVRDGEKVTDKCEILQHWSTEFQGLLTPPLADPVTQERLSKIAEDNAANELLAETLPQHEMNLPFSIEEVGKLVGKAKKGKAPGLDSLTYDVLKNDMSIVLLTNLFNMCLDNHFVPSCWKKAIINPIPKSSSADKRVPLNYRGISLLSVVSKLYTAGLSNRISKYLEENNLLSNEQNGFRPKRSCLDHIYTLYNTCQIRLQQKLNTYLTFIDFSKAFDYVKTPYLLNKLQKIGIHGNIYLAIKELYTNPQSCVQLNGHLGGWFPVKAGVRQGDSLSPTLFSIFIDDLAQQIKDVEGGIEVAGHQLALLMYADDIVIISGDTVNAQSN